MKTVQVLDDTRLLPDRWSDTLAEHCYFFNPAITRFRSQILMLYRVVTPDGQRRLALCRLTPDFQIASEPVVPFSEFIQQGGDWYADGRFCTFQDRLFVHYNDGALRGRNETNHIYLVEVDPDRLIPRGYPRELVLEGQRQPVEKNWILFAHDDELWAIYTISPHIVLRVTWTERGPLVCRPLYRHDWKTAVYTHRYGELRGGTPPVRVGDHYISFFHSCFPVQRWRHLLRRFLRKAPHKILRYVGGAYGFAAAPPFAPCWLDPTPLILPPPLPRRQHPQLDRRVERSAYPCGALLQGQHWLVSFGSQEEYCCLAKIAVDSIERIPALAVREL